MTTVATCVEENVSRHLLLRRGSRCKWSSECQSEIATDIPSHDREVVSPDRPTLTHVIQDQNDSSRRAGSLTADALEGLARVLAGVASGLTDRHGAVPGDVVRLGSRSFGDQQRAILSLRGLDGPLGMTARQIATVVGMERTNAHRLMARLEKLALLTRVADRPARWVRAEV